MHVGLETGSVTPLGYAIEVGDLEMTELLIDKVIFKFFKFF